MAGLGQLSFSDDDGTGLTGTPLNEANLIDPINSAFSKLDTLLGASNIDNAYLVAPNLASDPSAGNKGRLIFNSTDNVLKVDDGTNILTVATTGNLPEVECGTYTGDGTDDRTISLTASFTPDFVLVFGDAAVASYAYIAEIGGDDSKSMAAANALETNKIQAVSAGGFQVGSQNPVNQNGVTFYYIAIKEAWL